MSVSPRMSRNKYENGVSYYDITRKIEEFVDYHSDLDSKQEKELNLMELLLYTMEYPSYMNHYDSMRETILENIQSNYERVGNDPDFLAVCADWIEMYGDA
jgi:hypothetical protein